jgi:hypothetical protein
MESEPIWMWLNLLSLDAPLVAVLWQDFLERCYPSTLLPAGRWVLGLTVWAIYIADRLLDVRGEADVEELRHHRFCREHRAIWCAVLGMVVAADVGCTFFWLRPVVFVNGLLVAAASLGYLAVFTSASRGLFWKKSAAAVLFSAGVFLVTVANSRGGMGVLVMPWLCFAVLCGGNLWMIQLWKTGQSAKWTNLVVMAFGILCVLVGQARWYYAVGASAALLVAIHYQKGKVSVEARRVMADLALFTPFFLR